jgi:enoyl-CoA hydratase/carnithine racemase
MPDPILLRDDADGIATLTLNTPHNLNALSSAMLAALATALAQIAQDRQCQVVVLRAAGKAFCAGHDLKEMQAMRMASDGGTADFTALFQRCAGVMQALIALPQVVIAEVQGVAAAAGCQLVASCDMVVASEAARFGVNGVTIGLFCSTPMVALTRKVPPAVAFEMLTTGSFLTAPRALEVGLINRIATSAQLGQASRDLALSVAAKPAAVVKIGKSAFYDQIGLPLDQAYTQTGAVMVENLAFRETAEGMAAFLEKRPPDWSLDQG